jgi:acyl-CoA dehydrogenase
VVRPIAAEYDERQAFPRPMLEEAARRGFYSPLFYRDLIGDPTGLSLPRYAREVWRSRWRARPRDGDSHR